jgi:hypothetical protein
LWPALKKVVKHLTGGKTKLYPEFSKLENNFTQKSVSYFDVLNHLLLFCSEDLAVNPNASSMPTVIP